MQTSCSVNKMKKKISPYKQKFDLKVVFKLFKKKIQISVFLYI